ncbi:hypothetical protein WN55_00447 [Dufourea novaeangliae]|uniref:Uncharacterized protein n=1 Tax=Dufourea novaeangliae TaxID=178035 RepID=A0A154PD94_DUFNO|nr:hypothetical protein WN55_00447 [Dufourea novaeangliae]
MGGSDVPTQMNPCLGELIAKTRLYVQDYYGKRDNGNQVARKWQPVRRRRGIASYRRVRKQLTARIIEQT